MKNNTLENKKKQELDRKNIIKEVGRKFNLIFPYLNEKSRRIWCATEANSFGWGGETIVYEATNISPKTIRKGLSELKNENKKPEVDRIREKGGGRKKIKEQNPDILKKLEALVEPLTRGDPESPLLWTSKSSQKLCEELNKEGYEISQRSVWSLLTGLGYSLQSNKKTKEGANHPDRDAQFEYINKSVKEFQEINQPVISIDAKKKENIGNFKNNGREYSPKGKPIEVNGHDFPDEKLGKACPYGVYDITKNNGWVSVGISKDTAEFAVESIRNWWREMGRTIYPNADKILITADCGGSNGYRTRLWKVELQKLSNELSLEIHVRHFPPGTSKWNKIEHKMFSFISKNWRGQPLIDRATIVNLIGNTKTKNGLLIKAILDERIYKTGIVVSDEEFNNINIEKEFFHGEWNYKIIPL